MFTQRGTPNADPVPGFDGVAMDALCFNCNSVGHMSYQCPELTEEERSERRSRRGQRNGASLLQFVYSLTQISPDEFSTITPNWLLLDTCSTDNVINNETLVKNIRPCKKGEEIKMVTNGENMDFNKEADLLMLPIKVYFNKDSIDTFYRSRNCWRFQECTLLQTQGKRELSLYTLDTRQCSFLHAETDCITMTCQK